MLYIRDFEKMGASFHRESVEQIDGVGFYNLGTLRIDNRDILVRVYLSKYCIPKIVGVQGDSLSHCVEVRKAMMHWVVKNILHNKNGIWVTLARRWAKRFSWLLLLSLVFLYTCINLWSLSKEPRAILFLLCTVGAILLTALIRWRGRFFYERIR